MTQRGLLWVMLVIRRLVDKHRAYTGIFLRGEPPQIFPTSDHEHARILAIYKQDRPYEGIHNDFSEYGLGTVAALSNKKRQG
jgi:hypothetical protein